QRRSAGALSRPHRRVRRRARRGEPGASRLGGDRAVVRGPPRGAFGNLWRRRGPSERRPGRGGERPRRRHRPRLLVAAGFHRGQTGLNIAGGVTTVTLLPPPPPPSK